MDSPSYHSFLQKYKIALLYVYLNNDIIRYDHRTMCKAQCRIVWDSCIWLTWLMLVSRNCLEQEKEWMAWEGWGQFWEWRERVSSFERGWEHLRLSASPQAVWSSYWPPLRLLAPLCFLESLFKWASRKSSKCMWHWLKGTRISCRKPFESENATIGSEVPTCLIFDSELLRIVSRLFICWTVHCAPQISKVRQSDSKADQATSTAAFHWR